MSYRVYVVEKTLFDRMREALLVTDKVLEKERFTGMDQNPSGVRDLVGSVVLDLNNLTVTSVDGTTVKMP